MVITNTHRKDRSLQRRILARFFYFRLTILYLFAPRVEIRSLQERDFAEDVQLAAPARFCGEINSPRPGVSVEP